MFKNIIQNARDALIDKQAENKLDKKISISATRRKNYVAVEIKDNGIGIKPEHIAQIYDAFFSTKPETGTGLGLGMVHKIVGIYQGKIEVESEVGEFAKFTVTLPIEND